MSGLARLENGVWIEHAGTLVLAPRPGSLAKARKVPAGTLRRLEREGRTGDLAAMGLTPIGEEAAPEGKRRIGGTERIEARDDEPMLVYDYEDIPARPVLSRAEKFDRLAASAGLTPEELTAELAARLDDTAAGA